MHSNISVKGHPVIYRRLIVSPSQHSVLGLVGKAEHTGRRHIALAHISRYKIRFQHHTSADIQIQMLIGQVDLHIGGAYVILSLTCALGAIYRLSFLLCAFLYQLDQLCGLLLFVSFPTIGAACQGRVVPVVVCKFSSFFP